MQVSANKLIRYEGGGSEFTAPPEITEIGELAFAGSDGLVMVTLPDSVDVIGNYAFMNCYTLREIRLPSRVSRIGSGLFCNCWKLRRIAFPEGLAALGGEMLESCHALTEISLPSTLQTVERTALSGCRSLRKIHIAPDMLEVLPPSARYTAALTFMEEHASDALQDAALGDGFALIDAYVADRQRSFLDLAVNRRSTDAVRYMLSRGLLSDDPIREFLAKASRADRVEITALLLGAGRGGGPDPVLSGDPFL